MRFTKLVVANFQAVDRAEVEFGTGLNVLFGPNDLGKSTLACAIRAALLVPPASAGAEPFSPWHVDAQPKVVLTLTDDDGHYWRVKKAFGGSNAAAELSHSKDGMTFTLDCKGREVEEQIRKKLRWGIPGPGGKGGRQALPESFLAHVLLADQTDVDTILAKSLEEDVEDSGKLRLAKALAAAAQDPLFKKLLASAQKEVDEYFTPKGMKKRGKDSPFTVVADDVKRHSSARDTLKKQVDESIAIEATVRRLREERTTAQERLLDATGALDSMRMRQARAAERAGAEARLAEAKEALAVVDQRAADVAEHERAVEELGKHVARAEAELVQASGDVVAAEAAVRAAEEACRAATSEDGERQRELRRAQLRQESAESAERIGACEKRRDAAAAAVTARSKAEAARAAATKARRDVETATREAEEARTKLADAEKQFELARATVAYGRWRTAADAQKQSEAAREAAHNAKEEADAKERAAAEHDAQATRFENDVSGRRAFLPDAATVAALEKLDRDLEVAKSALGGGLSIALRGTGKVAVRAIADGNEILSNVRIDGHSALEAERTATLSIGDLLEVEIAAGAAEQRRHHDELRKKWDADGAPVLARAAVSSLMALRGVVTALADDEAKAKAAKTEAARLRSEALALRERAATQEARVAELVARAAGVAERDAAIGPHDRAALAASFEKLGPTWETQAEKLQNEKKIVADGCREAVGKKESSLGVAAYRVGEEEKHAAALEEEARAAAAIFGGNAQPEDVVRQADAEIVELRARRGAIETEIQGIEAEATKAAAEARQALDAAGRALDARKAARVQVEVALTSARSQHDTKRGQTEVLRAELAKIDRAAADALVEERSAAAAAFADDPPFVETDLVATQNAANVAEAAVAQLTRDLDQVVGALTKVGGAAVREELARVEEALESARQRERELEQDADAWQLLRDTLREVENEEGAHLGRALAAPVATRFFALTAGRYSELRLDAHLRAETVVPAAGPGKGDVLGALSVGTREQLATLIRLTIAEHLESAIILDDHLVQTDPSRLLWFREVLRTTALKTQVIVLTCRPQDYFTADELPNGTPVRDLAGGLLRAVDLAAVLRRREIVMSEGAV